jgi:membrane protein DedA with SNARE-associated domain
LQIGFLFLEANLPFPCGMMNAHVHKFIFYVLILIAFWTFFLLFHRFDFSFSWFAPMISLPGGHMLFVLQIVPAWLSCLPIKNDLIEAKVVHDQLCSMVER